MIQQMAFSWRKCMQIGFNWGDFLTCMQLNIRILSQITGEMLFKRLELVRISLLQDPWDYKWSRSGILWYNKSQDPCSASFLRQETRTCWNVSLTDLWWSAHTVATASLHHPSDSLPAKLWTFPTSCLLHSFFFLYAASILVAFCKHFDSFPLHGN